jgi:hypothetical protein
VLERYFSSILFEIREHLQKNFLGEVFARFAPRQPGCDDAEHVRVKLFNQAASGLRILLPHPA